MVDAGLESFGAVLRRCSAGDDDDRDLGDGPDLPANRDPADARHDQIQENHVGGVFAQLLNGLLTATGIIDCKTLRYERDAERAPDLGIVIHNQDSQTHCQPQPRWESL